MPRAIPKLLGKESQNLQGVHKVSLQFKKLLKNEMMRYCNEVCFMLINIS